MNTKIKLIIVSAMLIVAQLLSACDLSGGLVGPMDAQRAREVNYTTCMMENPKTYHKVCSK